MSAWPEPASFHDAPVKTLKYCKSCQQQTPHLARLGARLIPRRAFAEALARLVHSPQPAGAWSVDAPPVDAP